MSFEIAARHRLAGLELRVCESFPARGITALFGPSGAGKTTLLKFIAGLWQPGQGRLSVDGRILFESSTKTQVPARQRRFGYVSQRPLLFPHLTVRGNLLFGWRRAGNSRGSIKPDEVISLLGLESLLVRRPGRLSGGEQQRVAIGRALLCNPQALLLDEPLAGLDGPRRDQILNYLDLCQARFRLPMLLVTHDLNDVVRLADHLIILDQGRVVGAGDIFEVTSSLDLWPYTGHLAAGSVLAAAVSAHTGSISELRFPGGTLKVPHLPAHIGDQVRVRVRARDVMLSLHPVDGVSANNVLPATLVALKQLDDVHVQAQLDLGGSRLLALITRDSAQRLDLKAGMSVFGVVKSVTVNWDGPRKLDEID